MHDRFMHAVKMASEATVTPSSTPSNGGAVEIQRNQTGESDQVEEKSCVESRLPNQTSTRTSDNVCDNQQRLDISLEKTNTNNDNESNDRPVGVSTESKPLNQVSTDLGDKPQLGDNLEGLTKNQLRKLKKSQKWAQNKDYRLEKRQKERQARKLKRQAQKCGIGEDDQTQNVPKKRKKRMSDPDASDVRVVIDCGFDDLMHMQDVTKLSKQIQRSYSSNRTSDKPFQFYISNFGGQTKHRFQNVIPDHASWDVHVKEEGLNDLFGKDAIVYLTSDSPEVLTELDSSKVYVIGGLVDHNHHKGVCYERAISQGWGHAQLPISEYMKFSTRKVLTVNHVFEILVAYNETQDWKAAFERVIPPRKFHTTSRRERRRLAYEERTNKECVTKDGGEQEEEVHDGSKGEGSSDEEEAAEHSGSGDNATEHCDRTNDTEEHKSEQETDQQKTSKKNQDET